MAGSAGNSNIVWLKQKTRTRVAATILNRGTLPVKNTGLISRRCRATPVTAPRYPPLALSPRFGSSGGSLHHSNQAESAPCNGEVISPIRESKSSIWIAEDPNEILTRELVDSRNSSVSRRKRSAALGFRPIKILSRCDDRTTGRITTCELNLNSKTWRG